MNLYQALLRTLNQNPDVRVAQTFTSSDVFSSSYKLDDVVELVEQVPGIQAVKADNTTREITTREKDLFGRDVDLTYSNMGLITVDFDEGTLRDIKQRQKRGYIVDNKEQTPGLRYLETVLNNERIYPFVNEAGYLGYRLQGKINICGGPIDSGKMDAVIIRTKEPMGSKDSKVPKKNITPGLSKYVPPGLLAELRRYASRPRLGL